jgi:retron-type reverse transcriptase
LKTYKKLWDKLTSFENLEDAYLKARKRKTNNPKVVEFDEHWRLNLCILLRELRDKTYRPRPLKRFVLRDPKTRIICVSDFRDRVVHHALVNILQPIFEPRFIYDSYASRKGKGTMAALQRFDLFKRRVTKNGRLTENARNDNDVAGYVLKADIKQYFQTVDHKVLSGMMRRRVKDENVMWLVRTILENNTSQVHGKSMPLGNWTSQFFANVYLNELDQFVKHKLKAKYYIRYVDDFVILHNSIKTLCSYKENIGHFLKSLKLELHPEKCRIIPLRRGVAFLGFRMFYHHKIPRERNIRKIKARLDELLTDFKDNLIDVEDIHDTFMGWTGYARCGNTYKLRMSMLKEVQSELASSLGL